ncbi:hypothetical protein ACQ86N_25935 [Puia sp. P3]|uniref:hypothetical protein n=1 Tax=Puia sp. P3 TaxID=3423952 RepID=UPI003D676703
MVHAFHSKLFVLRVIQKGAEEFVQVIQNQTNLRLLDNTWDVKYEYKMGDYVVDSINEFAQTQGVRMIAMVPHRHSLPERWFMGSNTREMLFEANLPLLLLPEHT